MGDVASFYKGKTLLITGATGFLGKPLVEKILRQIPDIKRVILLVRPRSGEDPHESVSQRLEREILRSHVFAHLREFHGDRFAAFISEKVEAVPGDVSQPNLGLTEADVSRLTSEIDIIINSAAVVVFDERLDYAVESNTLGPLRLLEFAKQCRDPIFLHVSTSYVSGMRTGRVPEEIPEPDRSIFDLMESVECKVPSVEKGNAGSRHSTLDTRHFQLNEQIAEIICAARAIDGEARSEDANQRFREAAQKQLRSTGSTSDSRLRDEVEKQRKRWIAERLVKEGVSRARRFGWNDTYTFTKAMGEQVLVKNRGGVPTILLRPSIIESSYSEPEPGWIDGLRMADPIIAGYGKGRIPLFPADPDIILDFIPVDFVVNALLASIPVAREGESLKVFQVATSTENPLAFQDLARYCIEHFRRYPMRDGDGAPIVPTPWKYPTESQFDAWIARQKKKLSIAERICGWFSFLRSTNRLRREFAAKQVGLERLAYYNQIYGFYVRYHCQFATDHTRRLFRSLSKSDQQAFFFDPGVIDWREYIQEIHVPGLKRHVLKIDEDAREPLAEDQSLTERHAERELENLNQLLERAANRWPNKIAVQMTRDGQMSQFTYGQLCECALQTASCLRDAGIGRGDRVLLISENQPEWPMSYFACAALGATVVPVDRQTRDDEVIAIAGFTGAKALLGSASCASKLAAFQRTAGPRGEPEIPVLNVNNWCLPVSAATVEIPPFPAITAVDVEPDELASIIFTTGTSVDPKGVMLSHNNFLSNVLALAEMLPPHESDQMLSVLPVHHAFEFTGDLLVPILAGATITYVETLKSREILRAMQETQTTCLLGIPRMFEIFNEQVRERVSRSGPLTQILFPLLKLASSASLAIANRNIGKTLFAKVHEVFGGHLRILISGGAALDPKIHRDFTLMGFLICEGYGLTETAPVLTVNPIENSKRGSVGRALPGVRLRIANPDADGIGEIIARGASIFSGYYRNEAATEKVFRDGWFHTGDLGYLDDDGYLFITGRIKEIIVTSAGKNVYPDEVEALYKDVPGIRDLCVVGIKPHGHLGEEVHAVVYANEGGFTDHDERAILDAIQQVSRDVPSYQRPQRIHFWREELPRTPAMQIDRPKVRDLLAERLRRPEDDRQRGVSEKEVPDLAPEVIAILARLARVPQSSVSLDSSLQFDLNMDSLMRVEMILALETRFKVSLPEESASVVQTIRDTVDLVDSRTSTMSHATDAAMQVQSYWRRALTPDEAAEVLAKEPGSGGKLARSLFRSWMKMIYSRYLEFVCEGLENIPEGVCIIAPNHTSHLDTGAVLMAVGDRMPDLRILGARDYFFNTRIKGWFFRTILNVVPFDRHVNFVEGLRVSRSLLEKGFPLLIFPEGTRSTTGELQPFKPGLGLLAFELDVPIVPAYIRGAFEAWPKGQSLPRRRTVSIAFGQPIRCDRYRAKAANAMPYEIYQAIVSDVRTAIEQLHEQSVAQASHS